MKTLKFIFCVIFLSTIFLSCTPQALHDDQNNDIDNVQATGDDTSSTNNGSKD